MAGQTDNPLSLLLLNKRILATSFNSAIRFDGKWQKMCWGVKLPICRNVSVRGGRGSGRFNKLPPGQLESSRLRADNAVTYLKRSNAQKVKGAKVEKDLKYC